MKILEAIAQLDGAPLAPCYLLAGPSDYWAEKWLERFMARAYELYQEQVEMLHLGRSGSLPWNELVSAWQTPNLWGQAQLFHVQNLSAGPPPGGQATAFFQASRRHLILREVKPGIASRVFDQAIRVEAEPPPTHHWRRWISHLASLRKINLTPEGAELLARLIPQDGHHLEHELEKMQLIQISRWTGRAIEEWILPQLGEESVWTMTDALLAKDVAALYGGLVSALEQGKAPVMVLVLLGRQLISLKRAKRCRSLADFQAQEKTPAFVARKVFHEAKRWTEPELDRALGFVVKLDDWFKDSRGEPEVWLTHLALLLAG